MSEIKPVEREIKPVEPGRYVYECTTDRCRERGAQFVCHVPDAPWVLMPRVPVHAPCGSEPRLVWINDKRLVD